MVNFKFTLPDHVGMAANLKKGKGKRMASRSSPFTSYRFYFNDTVSVRPATSIVSLSSLRSQPIAR